jgi:hypothetical protein
MKKILLLAFGIVFLACKNKTDMAINAFVSNSSKPKKVQILKFQNALTYQFENNTTDEKQELWFYVNEKMKQILFVPNDDIVKAVVSYPNGKYEIYVVDENSQKRILKQQINDVSIAELKQNILKSTNEKVIIDQKNIQQKNIFCKGFRLDYLKMNGSELLFATTQIPVNSYQIYGFSRLEGDAKLPFSLDYINIFNKKQLITHIDREDVNMRLLNYGSNPYEFSTNGFH